MKTLIIVSLLIVPTFAQAWEPGFDSPDEIEVAVKEPNDISGTYQTSSEFWVVEQKEGSTQISALNPGKIMIRDGQVYPLAFIHRGKLTYKTGSKKVRFTFNGTLRFSFIIIQEGLEYTFERGTLKLSGHVDNKKKDLIIDKCKITYTLSHEGIIKTFEYPSCKGEWEFMSKLRN